MSWTCSSCTLMNNDRDENCTACGFKNPQAVLKYPDSNVAADCGQRGDILKYPESPQGSNDDEWICNKCCFKNSVSTTCEQCFTSKDDSMQLENATARPSHDQPDIVADGGGDDELRIVLIGRTGSGKSATGNSILGKNQFKAMVSGSSVTANCSRGQSHRGNRLLLVVDTPGLFDTNNLNFEVTREISKCIGMTCPGPHAVVLVIGIGRYTKEEQETVEHFLQHFGQDVLKYMMIVFTREDSLAMENMTIEDFIKNAPSELQQIVKRCKGRYIAMSNTANESEKKRKVDELIRKIDEMVQANGGVCYTNEMYAAAEEVLARRMEQIRAEFEQDQEREKHLLKHQISTEFEHDLKQLKDDKEKLENQLERMHWEKDYAEKEKQMLHREMSKLQQQRQQEEMDEEINRQLGEKIAALRKREVLLSQQLQVRERQRLLMLSDLEKAKHGIKKRSKSSKIDERTIRGLARDEVENKSPSIFGELLETLKNVGKSFLSRAIQFFTKLI